MFLTTRPPAIRTSYTTIPLKRIPEPWKTLNDLPTSISALVRPVQLQRHQRGDHKNHATGNDTTDYSRTIIGFILRPEDRGPDNPTDSTGAHQRRRAEGALPLPSDVIGLVGQHAGDVSIVGHGRQEDAEVPDTGGLAVAEEHEPHDGHDAIAEDKVGALVPLVCIVRLRVHQDGGGNIGRRDKALRRGQFETHAILQDDGKEVCDCVGAGRGETEEPGEAPDLEIHGGLEILPDFEWLGNGVVAILFDSGNNEGRFGFGEEAKAGGGLLGEVNDEVIPGEANGACDDSFHDTVVEKRISFKEHVINNLAEKITHKIHLQPAMGASRPLGAVGSAFVGP
jgi:hypothetical protein